MDPICPVDCSTNLPVVGFDNCNPNAVASEINKLYIAKPSASAFTDWEDPVEWGKRLSETNVVPGAPGNTTPVGDLIRPLTVIGDKPAPASVVKELSNQRRKNIRKDHTLNFTIDEITAENLEFARASECGSIVKFWYGTLGNMLAGGNSGIQNATLTMDVVLARGTDEVVAINGTLVWRAKFTEEFTLENPIAESN